MTDTSSWLAENGLEKYTAVFTEAEIELSDLAHLTDEDLKELGLPMGPRRRAIEAIKRLSDNFDSSVPEVQAKPASLPEAASPPRLPRPTPNAAT
jgi:hypothetical protein